MTTSTNEPSDSGSMFLFHVMEGKFESGRTSAPITGEIQLAITQNGPEETVQLVQLNLYSPHLVSWRGSTGDLSITALSGQGQIREGRLQLSLQARVQYAERTEAGYPMLAGIAGKTAVFPQPPTESFEGTLEGALPPPGADGTRILQDAILRLNSHQRKTPEPPAPPEKEPLALSEGAVPAQEPENGEIEAAAESVSFRLSAAAVTVAPIVGCLANRQTTRRVLPIQPIFFAGSATHPSTTGGTFNLQVTTAQAIWGQCCIDLKVNHPIVISNTGASQSGNFNTVVSALPTDQRRGNAVHVFVVENHLPPDDGGGLHFVNDIVLTDANSGNPTLLAHELGHIFSLEHQDGNVMHPSGSPNSPSPSNCSLQLCKQIILTRLQTGASACITAP